MKKVVKVILSMVAVIGLFGGALMLYLTLRPVKIIAVHQDKYSGSILVDHLPPLAMQRIKWWQKNKDMLAKKYALPVKWDEKNYNIYVWEFGDGYKELGKYDRLCFDDMPPPKNCIEKERLMYIFLNRHGEVNYWLNGTGYVQRADGTLDETGLD